MPSQADMVRMKYRLTKPQKIPNRIHTGARSSTQGEVSVKSKSDLEPIRI